RIVKLTARTLHNALPECHKGRVQEICPFYPSLRERIKWYRVARSTPVILAMEALDTCSSKNSLICVSFPSSLDRPCIPRGRPSRFPAALAAASASLDRKSVV